MRAKSTEPANPTAAQTRYVTVTQNTKAQVPLMAASTAFNTALEARAKSTAIAAERTAIVPAVRRSDAGAITVATSTSPPSKLVPINACEPARSAAALLMKTTSVNSAPNCNAGRMRNGLPCSTRASAGAGCCARVAIHPATTAIAIPTAVISARGKARAIAKSRFTRTTMKNVRGN